MPTYVCWTRAGRLSPEQRSRIVTAITDAHHDIARGPRYFVQVIFNDLEPGRHFIAGAEADPDHVWVRADIRAGRSPEQKTALMARIMDALCTITGAARENVWIYISDIPGPSVVEFGHPLPEPGGEEAWLARMPPALRERLRALQ